MAVTLSSWSVLRAQTITGGAQHSVAVLPAGTVWTWGGNAHGQLGDGSTTERHVPTDTGVTDAVTAAAGTYHTLVATSTGTVLAWGQNNAGQLGDGTTTTRLTPTAVSGLQDITVVAAGEGFSLALDTSGVVWSWGANGSGQLGHGHTSPLLVPTPITTLSNVVALSARHAHVLALKTDGTVWAWGTNFNGQLGNGTTTGSTLPVQVPGISTATAVAAGQAHSLALLADGTLRAWGANSYGQLGDASTTQRLSPVAVNGLTTVAALAGGGYHSLARRADGSLYAWGYNAPGSLGDGTTGWRSSPVAVLTGPIAVAGAGHATTYAATAPGVVSTWGANVHGERGDGTTTSTANPQAISEAGYLWLVGWPRLSLSTAIYTTDKTVSITTATPGATIHYTTDGSAPTELSDTVVSGGSLAVDRSMALRVKAYAPSLAPSREATATYTMQVAHPSRTPGPGTYTSSQVVALATPTPQATLRYTLDGSPVTSASPLYVTPLPIATTTALRVMGFREGWTSSPEVTGTYQMNFGALDAPVIAQVSGTYTSGVEVSISTTPALHSERHLTDHEFASLFGAAGHHDIPDGHRPGVSSGLHRQPACRRDVHHRGGDAGRLAHLWAVSAGDRDRRVDRDRRRDASLHLQ